MLAELSLISFDNNGRRALTGMYLPDGTPAGSALAFANLVRPRYLALTQNRLTGAKYVVRLAGPDLGTAAPGADSRRSATLFYSAGADVARLVIPSPVPGLAELAGPFAGYRITRESAQAAGLLDELEALVAGTITATGAPWPSDFEVGSIDERT